MTNIHHPAATSLARAPRLLRARRRSCTPLKAPRHAPAESARPGPLARRSEQSADGARGRESLLAALFRRRPRRDRERLRHPGHAADASRTARLAGHRVHRPRLEHEGDAPADRHLGDLSPIVEGAARAGDASIRAIGCWPGRTGCGSEAEIVRDEALAASGLLIAQDRRPERLSAAARGVFTLHAGAARLEAEHRPRPLSPRHVHLLLALGPASRL